MRQIQMKSIMRHFDLSSIQLFLYVAATRVYRTKNFTLLRKNRILDIYNEEQLPVGQIEW